MVVYVADQTLTFIYSCVLGTVLGVIYDVFRISRVAFPTNRLAVFIEDVVFFAICALSTFFLLMGTVHGRIRGFLVLGVMIGAVLYYFTIGRLVMSVSRIIINAIKMFFEFIFAYVISPVWRFFYNIISLIARPFYFLSEILIKSLGKANIYLKVRRDLLYNHIAGYFFKRAGTAPENASAKAPKKKRDRVTFSFGNRFFMLNRFISKRKSKDAGVFNGDGTKK